MIIWKSQLMMRQMKLQNNLELSKYQNNLESMKGSQFVFGYVNLLYYKSHKINPNCGGSYIGSPDWIQYKKETIDPINKKAINPFNMQ